jgi:hypothetical protein
MPNDIGPIWSSGSIYAAEGLGYVSAACLAMGVDHSTRYRLKRNWLHQFRRLGVRWERPDLHEAVMHVACAFICRSELRSTRLLPGDSVAQASSRARDAECATFAFHAGGTRRVRILALGGPLASRVL